MNGQTDEWTNGQTNDWKNGLMVNERTDEWTNKEEHRTKVHTDGLTDKRRNGQAGEQSMSNKE